MVIRSRIAQEHPDVVVSLIGPHRHRRRLLRSRQLGVHRVHLKRHLIDIRLTQQVPTQISHVGNLREELLAELLLDTQAELLRRAVLQVRIDGVDIRQRSNHPTTAARVCQIAVLQLRDLRNRRQIHLREDQIPLGAGVEDAITAPNHHGMRHGIGKTKPWRPRVLRFIETTGRTSRNLLEKRSGTSRHAPQLISRHPGP